MQEEKKGTCFEMQQGISASSVRPERCTSCLTAVVGCRTRRHSDGNRSAETLYGWKDYEVIGQRIQDLLIEDPIHEVGEKIIGKLRSGESWSVQLRFRKRTGEISMAHVTKSLLYEDGELAGVITVSSNAAIFNIINSEKLRTFQESGHDQNREQEGFNMKKIQWLPKPQSSSMPSSVSALVLMRLQKYLRVSVLKMTIMVYIQMSETWECKC